MLKLVRFPRSTNVERVALALAHKGIDVEGVVTTNASTVGTPPPAQRDAEVVRRLRAGGAGRRR